jgi:hypothetical protein
MDLFPVSEAPFCQKGQNPCTLLYTHAHKYIVTQ